MLRYLLVYVLVILGGRDLRSQDSTALDMTFKLLRQADRIPDFDAGQYGCYPAIKNIPIKASRLSLGGSYRGQYEYFKNQNFAFTPRENGWYLQRILLHAHLKTQSGLEVFSELGSSFIEGKTDLAPVDRNELYVSQFFMKYEKNDWSVEVGRKNLRLGSGRLIDVREGPNVRLSLDGVYVSKRMGNVTTQFFYSVPVLNTPGRFDDEVLHGERELWGAYLTKTNTKRNLTVDWYYLGATFGARSYTRGRDEESRHSLGFRVARSAAGLNFDNEAVLQLGTFGDEDIFAWTVSFHLWKEMKHITFGAKTELISGDDGEGSLETFNPLYPRGAYFGRVAQFAPSNLIDIHPYIKYEKNDFFVELDYDHFWRFSVNDGLYSPPAIPFLEGASDSRRIAGQFGVVTGKAWGKHVTAEFEANYIVAMEVFEDEIPHERDLFHLVFTTEFKF